jgi:hypothetical protein
MFFERVYQELQVKLGHLVNVVKGVLLENVVLLESLVNQEEEVHLVVEVILANQANVVTGVLLVHQVGQVHKVKQESKDMWVHPVHLDLLEIQGQKVPWEILV